jgi:Uma2 family endonuclease
VTLKTKSGATYDDLMKVPDTFVAEIVEGDLFASPRPRGRHTITATVLAGELVPPFHHGRSPGPGGWWIVNEPELHLGEDVLVPDVAGWRRERMPEYPMDVVGVEQAPDWLCEVLSPGTEALDRRRKLPVYARAGVAHVWLINPVSRTLELFRRSGTGWTLVKTCAEDEVVRAEPFEAIELDLLLLWGESRTV